VAKLAEYKKKRDPKKTPEPFGSKKRGKKPIFVVQRHDARRLHYDFRLERNGALASWAVPKGVPLEPGQQHLAVHVEDHPLEYGTFEGEIPKGQYGAGTVEIWDNGTYDLVEEKKDGGLTIRLHGKRLNGTYALVPAKLSGDAKNWLILLVGVLAVAMMFKTFLDVFENPNSQTSPSTANGAVYQNQFDAFFQQWERGKVDDLDAGLAKTDQEIDKALQLGQAP